MYAYKEIRNLSLTSEACDTRQGADMAAQLQDMFRTPWGFVSAKIVPGAPVSGGPHCCRSGAHLHTRHTIGGAEEHLNNKWGPVVPLVFGHFGEFNKELLEFIGKISESIAAQHHRKLGFKSELGGRSRAKAGIMQRISMVALRATARQVIRGVALVGAANVQAHSDRRAEKTAEAAKYDAFGPNHGGAFRPFDCGRAA
jgi:hypothetical protein